MLGGTSREMQSLSRTINAGAQTFQGLDFALTGMLGVWGMAIAAIAGLGAALISATGSTEKFTAALQRNQSLRYDLGLTLQKDRLKELTDNLAKATAEHDKMVASKARMTGRGGLLEVILGPSPEDVEGGTTRILEATKALKDFNEEIKKLSGAYDPLAVPDIIVQTDKEILSAEIARKEQLLGITDGLKDQLDILTKIEAIQKKGVGGELFVGPGLPKPAIGGGKMLEGADTGDNIRAWHEQRLRGISESIRKDNELLISGAIALSDTLRSELGGAFEEVFGTANSLLEKFAQRLAEILGQRMIFNVLSMIPGVGQFLGLGAGFINSTEVDPFGSSAGSVGRTSIAVEHAMSGTAYRLGSSRASSRAARLGRAA